MSLLANEALRLRVYQIASFLHDGLDFNPFQPHRLDELIADEENLMTASQIVNLACQGEIEDTDFEQLDYLTQHFYYDFEFQSYFLNEYLQEYMICHLSCTTRGTGKFYFDRSESEQKAAYKRTLRYKHYDDFDDQFTIDEIVCEFNQPEQGVNVESQSEEIGLTSADLDHHLIVSNSEITNDSSSVEDVSAVPHESELPFHLDDIGADETTKCQDHALPDEPVFVRVTTLRRRDKTISISQTRHFDGYFTPYSLFKKKNCDSKEVKIERQSVFAGKRFSAWKRRIGLV